MRNDDGGRIDVSVATTAGQPRPRMTTKRRTAQALLLAAVVSLLSLVGTAVAWAAPGAPVGNATFMYAGANVYPADAVGAGCSTFGLCGGVVDALAASAVPQYRSVRRGELVQVGCESSGVARVFGFFGVGDDVQEGWTAARDLTVFPGQTPPSCGFGEALKR